MLFATPYQPFLHPHLQGLVWRVGLKLGLRVGLLSSKAPQNCYYSVVHVARVHLYSVLIVFDKRRKHSLAMGNQLILMRCETFER